MEILCHIIAVVGLAIAAVYVCVVPLYLFVEHRILKKEQEEIIKKLREREYE